MSAWVSFDEIKQAVSLEMVIDHYRIELRRISATSLRGKCPLPMHGSDTSRASFTATLSKGTGGIWACQSRSCIAARGGKKGGNALDFVATMEGCSIRDAAVKLAEWFRVLPAAQQEKQSRDPEAELVSKGKQEGSEEVNRPLGFELKGIDHAHPYLASRGVTAEMAQRFGIGYFSGRGSMSGRIVFPIHNAKGELVAYAGRSIDESEPKYKFPAGFHKSLELYNLHRVVPGATTRMRLVVIVEGFFDCLKVSEAGFRCVAIMGSSISEAQADLVIRHFKAACVLLDGDEAGKQGTEDCLVRLGHQMFVYAPHLPAGKQPDTITAEEIRELLNTRE